MFSSLLRPSRKSRRISSHDRSPFASPYRTFASPGAARSPDGTRRRAAADYDSGDDSNEDEDDDAEEEVEEEESVDEEADKSDEDGVDDATPLLPIFSAAHLDALPVYNLTHTIRLMVVSRVETTLSWDQLRSPQVSQFLLKPMQQEIRTNHFSAATEYALIANCLQFNKEMGLNPGNSGTSRTRAMVCELLAIKLLREHSMRQLIDSLCYDFNPLQGQLHETAQDSAAERAPRSKWESSRRVQVKIARISCLEIAIRAQTKRYLAHPLVVQLLEAIWAGSIVFHSAADSMHRRQIMPSQNRGYGTSDNIPRPFASQEALQSGKQREDLSEAELTSRRAVTLYNPRDASLFKLSRLRVPRYRNLLSTGSFAVLLGLFLAVLVQRSLEITTLEVFFWFWAGGYMLDEIVGFNEQGFSLYIASFWNTFDLGILLILFVHLGLRIYGIVMPDTRKHTVANMAYDVLAADAILLFPRLFSVLDHYRYFSQLLIAFRMMAVDLMAVFVLIIISCSGFLVALTLSFGNEGIDTPSSVAYALLQMLMGYTPAAWDRWDGYNALGKTILTLFLFICHFLVVTILITVLTNSFMAIVQNANEEHQFVFAVNTLSMVKSDALFSYVAPTNILAWLLAPLRYFLPFRQFVKLNRTAIKATHFPILFSIYFYEKTVLQSSVMDAIDVVQPKGRTKKILAQKMPRLARAPSVATFRQDRALEEVFRRPFDSTVRNARRNEDRKMSTVVSNWMRNMDEVVASPPAEQDRKVVDRLEGKVRRRTSRLASASRNLPRSVASDPEEFAGTANFLSPTAFVTTTVDTTPSQIPDIPETTDADGDDELATDDNEEDQATLDRQPLAPKHHDDDEAPSTVRPVDYFSVHGTQTAKTSKTSSSVSSAIKSDIRPKAPSVRTSDPESPSRVGPLRRPNAHLRNASSATVLYKPVPEIVQDESSLEGGKSSPRRMQPFPKGFATAPASGAQTPSSKPTSSAAGQKTPKRQPQPGPRMRPIMPPKDNAGFQSAPNVAGLLAKPRRGNEAQPQRSSLEMDLVSDIGDNKAIGGGYVGAIPASVIEQMARSSGAQRSRTERSEDRDMFGRLMMARMNTLEEGFREVVHEMRENLRRERSSRSESRSRSRSREKAARPAPQYRPPHLRKGKEKLGGSGRESAATSVGGTDRSVGDKENENTERNTQAPLKEDPSTKDT